LAGAGFEAVDGAAPFGDAVFAAALGVAVGVMGTGAVDPLRAFTSLRTPGGRPPVPAAAPLPLPGENNKEASVQTHSLTIVS
jgi:hypothetical protein